MACALGKNPKHRENELNQKEAKSVVQQRDDEGRHLSEVVVKERKAVGKPFGVQI